MEQPTQAPADRQSGEIKVGPDARDAGAPRRAAKETTADGQGALRSDAAELGLPLRHRPDALAARRVRLTDDPEILEQTLAGLLNLP